MSSTFENVPKKTKDKPESGWQRKGEQGVLRHCDGASLMRRSSSLTGENYSSAFRRYMVRTRQLEPYDGIA